MNFVKKNGCGILLSGIFALIATLLTKISIGPFSFDLIGAPVFSILFGMILTLIFPNIKTNTYMGSGIKFTSKKFCNMQL